MSVFNLNQARGIDNPFDLDNSELTFPVTTRPLYGFNQKTEKADIHVPNHVGVFRAMDNMPMNLGVVGNKYKLVSNRSVYEAAETGFMDTLTPAQLDGAKVTERASFNGAWSERVYTFPAIGDQLQSLGGAKSNIGFQARVQNSYDGSSSLRMVTGFIDFYCDNGMVLGSMIDQSKRRHTSGLTPEYVKSVITMATGNVQQEMARLQEMNNSVVDNDKVLAFFKSVFSEQRADRMMDQYKDEVVTRGHTVWSVYSAMTFYASHNSSAFPVRETGNDNVARTLANRSDEVATIANGTGFRQLLAA